MARGKRRHCAVQPRRRTPAPYRRRAGVEPEWGDFAAARYRETLSRSLVCTEIEEKCAVAVSSRQLRDYLRTRRDVILCREPTAVYRHDGVIPALTDDRWERVLDEAQCRLDEGETEAAVDDWLDDEVARYGDADHLCYTDEPLFNSRESVAAMIRRLKKWHRSVGRPVAGEGFEDLLAGVWSDVGYEVVMSPRNYDGADAHVGLANQWVAMSMKSESADAKKRTIRLSSLSSHDVTLDSAEACRNAVIHATVHLGRYERMIYLRNTLECFPGTDDAAQRYTLFELPKADIFDRLLRLDASAFMHLFAVPEQAERRNSFTVPVRDEHGRRLFSVTVSKRPPRVYIGAIEFSYCRLIASYWTEPADEVKRMSRADAVGDVYGHGLRRAEVSGGQILSPGDDELSIS